MSLIDLHIAQKLIVRRKALRLSRKALGQHLGISYQQIHKYETGKNRIPASRLYQLSQMLYVPVGYFFEDLPKLDDAQNQMIAYPETPKLLNAYFNIPQSNIRKSFASLLEMVGQISHKL